jgi:hypothetical protein
MRLNSINPKDNPMEEVLYCFGGDTDSGDAGDVESGKQGMGPAASGPQRDLGAKSDVADYSKDDSDRRVQSTGSTTNFNIDRSQPSVSTASGRVYGTQTNLDRAIASGDLDITPSAIDSYTPETEEARSAFVEAGGIMPRDPSAVDTSALDEIAYEFDTINVESEFYEDQILRDLRKEDYSAVFDQPITRAGQVINVDPDASLTQSPAGQVESIKGGRSQSAKTASDDTGFRFFEETPLVDALGDDPYQLEEESGFDLGLGQTVPKSPEPSGADLASTPRSLAIEDLVRAYQSSVLPDQLLEGTDPQNLIAQVEGLGTVGDQRPLSIPEIQNLTENFLRNPANRETVDGFPVTNLQASTSTAPSPAEPVDLATQERQIGYPSSPIDLDFVTLANKIGPDPTVEQIRELYEANPVGGFGALTAYAQKEADQGRSVPRSVSDYISGKTDTLPSSEIDKNEEFGVTAREMDDAEAQRNRAIAAAAAAAEAQGLSPDLLDSFGYDYPETFDPQFTGLEMFDPEAQQTRKPSEGPPETANLKPDEDSRRITQKS